MIWTEEHLKRPQHFFPKPRGSVKNAPLLFLQALQSMAENAPVKGQRFATAESTLPKIYHTIKVSAKKATSGTVTAVKMRD